MFGSAGWLQRAPAGRSSSEPVGKVSVNADGLQHDGATCLSRAWHDRSPQEDICTKVSDGAERVARHYRSKRLPVAQSERLAISASSASVSTRGLAFMLLAPLAFATSAGTWASVSP